MLFNEPKLLKYDALDVHHTPRLRFSALQRAEIAEMRTSSVERGVHRCFSALQRAEIAEISRSAQTGISPLRFSALQRAEIAEMMTRWQ